MEALFLKVLNMSLTAGYVIIAIILMRILLSKAPKKYSYYLWAAAAFRLCCPVSFQSVFSLFCLKPFEISSQNGNTLSLLPGDMLTMQTPEFTADTPEINTSIKQTLPTDWETADVNPAQVMFFIRTIVWCIGISVMLLYGVITYIRLKKRMNTAVLLEDNVYQSDKVRSPFILGFIKPKIYIPYNLNESTRDYILMHERYHLKRFDHIIKPFAYLLLTVYWFNPLCWIAFYLMSRDMEMSCDEKVLGEKENIRKAYSTSLLSFAANRRFPSPSPLSFGETDIKIRIENILKWQKPKKWIKTISIIICAAVFTACSLNPVKAEDKSEILGYFYCVTELSYNAPQYSFVYPVENAPKYHVTFDCKLMSKEDGGKWEELGKLNEFKLSKNNFDKYITANGYAAGFEDGYSAAKIRRANQKAYKLSVKKDDINILYYLLKQKNGDIYLAYGYKEQPSNSIRWLFKLEKTNETQKLVTKACLYMNPLSSFGALDGDSGYEYLLDNNSFTVIDKSTGNILASISLLNLKWEKFPYSNAQWKNLFSPDDFNVVDISGYQNPLIMEISDQYSLLNMDGDIWLLEIHSNPQMGEYIWSIYVLEVKEN